MCVCGWQLVALAVFIPLLTIGYGEIEGHRRSKADRLAFRRQLAHAVLAQRETARHRTGESVDALRARHDADTLPYYPSPPPRSDRDADHADIPIPWPPPPERSRRDRV